jgi:hypothetical protein
MSEGETAPKSKLLASESCLRDQRWVINTGRMQGLYNMLNIMELGA